MASSVSGPNHTIVSRLRPADRSLSREHGHPNNLGPAITFTTRCVSSTGFRDARLQIKQWCAVLKEHVFITPHGLMLPDSDPCSQWHLAVVSPPGPLALSGPCLTAVPGRGYHERGRVRQALTRHKDRAVSLMNSTIGFVILHSMFTSEAQSLTHTHTYQLLRELKICPCPCQEQFCMISAWLESHTQRHQSGKPSMSCATSKHSSPGL